MSRLNLQTIIRLRGKSSYKNEGSKTENQPSPSGCSKWLSASLALKVGPRADHWVSLAQTVMRRLTTRDSVLCNAWHTPLPGAGLRPHTRSTEVVCGARMNGLFPSSLPPAPPSPVDHKEQLSKDSASRNSLTRQPGCKIYLLLKLSCIFT